MYEKPLFGAWSVWNYIVSKQSIILHVCVFYTGLIQASFATDLCLEEKFFCCIGGSVVLFSMLSILFSVPGWFAIKVLFSPWLEQSRPTTYGQKKTFATISSSLWLPSKVRKSLIHRPTLIRSTPMVYFCWSAFKNGSDGPCFMRLFRFLMSWLNCYILSANSSVDIALVRLS